MEEDAKGPTRGTEDRGGSTPDRAPNDDRGDAKNPNSAAYAADVANQATQRKETGK